MNIWMYLRGRILLLVMYLLAIALIALTLAVDGTATTGTGVYALGCGVLVLVIAVWADFLRIRRRCRLLDWQIRSDQDVLQLPAPMDEVERRYQTLLEQTGRRGRQSLLEAQQQALENNDFVSAWVHEVKTPITAMSLLLEADTLNQDAVLSLREEVARIQTDVEKVLFNARGDAFHQDYLLAEEELQALVHGCIKRHASMFIHKRIRLDNQMQQGLMVYTDRKWLDFILDQLLSNALKYTPQGGEITLTTRHDPKQTVLCIRDNGCGIKADDLPRLFRKSFTGYNGRQSNGATGFGLYLSHKLAKKLGHHIQLESVWGQGTSVLIVFPVWQDYYQPDLV